MKDLSIDDISTRIIDAVLNERHINRAQLEILIKPILKIWLKKTDSFKSQKVNKSKLQFTIENREIQQKFWLNKVRDMIGSENMKPLYEELDQVLISEGYKLIKS